MNFILKTAPSFLRTLDNYLRVNHSWIWMTRIHIHIYLALIAGIVFSGVGFAYYFNIKDVPGLRDQDSFFLLLFIPATVFCVYILYNMSLFNTDKSHAYRFRYQGFFIFLIYFLSLALPLIIPYSASCILNKRIAALVEDRQFNQDMKQLNEGLPFFPRYNFSDYDYYPSDSVYLYERSPKKFQEGDYNSDIDYGTRQFWETMRDSIFFHTGVFENKRPHLYYNKSRLWDDVYYEEGLFWGRTYEHLAYDYNSDSLFNLYIQNFNLRKDKAKAAEHIAQTTALLLRYSKGYQAEPDMVLRHYMENYYKPDVENHYLRELPFDETINNVTNIYMAKLDRADAFDKGVFSGLLIAVFCMALLFQIFKNVHWKQFLLGAAIFAIIMTLIVVVEVISNMRGQFFSMMGVILPFLLLIASIKGFSITRFSWILNQVSILLNVVLPFYPLLVVFYFAEFHGLFQAEYFDQFKIYSIDRFGVQQWEYSPEYYVLITFIWMCAFWSGILGYVFIWNSYLKTLYLRYWSLPKNK